MSLLFFSRSAFLRKKGNTFCIGTKAGFPQERAFSPGWKPSPPFPDSDVVASRVLLGQYKCLVDFYEFLGGQFCYTPQNEHNH